MASNLIPSWVASSIQNILLSAIQYGPIPAHIGFILDGNRRFERRNQLKAFEGHREGMKALEKERERWREKKTIELCHKIGIQAVTIYIFSIENFKRSQAEIDAIMSLAEVKFVEFTQPRMLLDRCKGRMLFHGDTHLLPEKMRENMKMAAEDTAHNKGFTVNMCISYTSRYEIARAIRETVAQHSHSPTTPGAYTVNNITAQTLTDNMLVPGDPPLDLLVRTSGTHRLSDFLLWQCHQRTQIVFLEVLWPEFGFWSLLYVLLLWQSRI